MKYSWISNSFRSWWCNKVRLHKLSWSRQPTAPHVASSQGPTSSFSHVLTRQWRFCNQKTVIEIPWEKMSFLCSLAAIWAAGWTAFGALGLCAAVPCERILHWRKVRTLSSNIAAPAFTLSSWWYSGRYVAPKRRLTSKGLHGILP